MATRTGRAIEDFEPATLKPLVEKPKSRGFPNQSLDPVTPPVEKQDADALPLAPQNQMAGE